MKLDQMKYIINGRSREEMQTKEGEKETKKRIHNLLEMFKVVVKVSPVQSNDIHEIIKGLEQMNGSEFKSLYELFDYAEKLNEQYEQEFLYDVLFDKLFDE